MKTSGITIAFGAIGSAFKFNKNILKRSDGSSEYYKVLWSLCRNPKIDKIILLSKSDYFKSLDNVKEVDPDGKIMEFYNL